jgi:uncharacterized protein YjiS (DUF1127 family)
MMPLMSGFLTADPQGFGDRHAVAYRVAYRLTGDSGQAMEAAAHGLARADARLLPHAPLSRLALACRLTAERALAAEDPTGPDSEHARLRQALRALSSRQRDVFVLAALADLPLEDVARCLGMAQPWCVRQYGLAEETVRASMAALDRFATLGPALGGDR